MASNRSNAGSRAAAPAVQGESPTSALVAVARHATRVHVAAAGAGGRAVAGWAHAADRLARATGGALRRRVDGETDTGQLIACVASAGHIYLRDLTALPGAAADHFEARLARDSSNR